MCRYNIEIKAKTATTTPNSDNVAHKNTYQARSPSVLSCLCQVWCRNWPILRLWLMQLFQAMSLYYAIIIGDFLLAPKCSIVKSLFGWLGLSIKENDLGQFLDYLSVKQKTIMKHLYVTYGVVVTTRESQTKWHPNQWSKRPDEKPPSLHTSDCPSDTVALSRGCRMQCT